MKLNTSQQLNGRLVTAAVAVLALAGSGACTKQAATEGAPPGAYRTALQDQQRSQAERGKVLFLKSFSAAEGMGPYFNEPSCSACHSQPTAGGHAGMDKAARNAMEGGDIDGYPQKALPGYLPLATPRGAPVSRHRPPPLYGLGLIQDLPDAAIADHCGRDAALGIQGLANVNPGEKAVGRFGYKAHTSSLRNFIANALNLEMGLTNPAERDPRHYTDRDAVADPEVPTSTVDDLTAYVYALAPPSAPAANPEAERLFAEVGCANCHRPQTALAVAAYSDLCVHDLGAGFDNGLTDFLASKSQWRTAPLWGLRWRNKYFHDDRASSLQDAIARHDGEAARVRERFAALPSSDQQTLLAWLKTL